jgi:hypothetical protein
MIETQLKVTLAPKDDPEAIAMLQANVERNDYDPEVLGYPSSLLLRCDDESKRRGYLTTQSVQMVESIALDDKLTSQEKAEAAMNLIAFALSLANRVGQKEAYFVASDPVTERAMKQMQWEKIEHPVYRLRLRKVFPDAV